MLSGMALHSDTTSEHPPPAASTELPENLQEALVSIFRPIIQELDTCVEEARNSQQDLKRQIDILTSEVHMISSICDVSPTLDSYAKKMTTIKRRVTVMHNILQNVQDRLRKLEHLAATRPALSATSHSAVVQNPVVSSALPASSAPQ